MEWMLVGRKALGVCVINYCIYAVSYINIYQLILYHIYFILYSIFYIRLADMMVNCL